MESIGDHRTHTTATINEQIKEHRRKVKVEKEAQEKIAEIVCYERKENWGKAWDKQPPIIKNHYLNLAGEILSKLFELGYLKLPKDKSPLLNEIKRDDYFENELEWLYQRLASDVEALVPEVNQDNVRWVIKDNFGKEILKAQREADIKFYMEENSGK